MHILHPMGQLIIGLLIQPSSDYQNQSIADKTN